MAPKMKSRQKASQEYWEEREKEALKQTRLTEEQFAAEIEKIYGDMRREVNSRISNWYVRYADESGIDIAEAKKRVSKLDMEEYAELARKYVELARKEETRALAFTDEANEQMKLYNLTMKVNRLENLKAQIGLELCGGFSQLEKKYGTFLNEQMMGEFDRQSGILAMTTQRPEAIRRQAEAVVNGSFHNATFSERLWNQQDALKGELDRLLARSLIQGLNPRAVAPELRKKFGASEMAADLLMITELCRVQTEAQKLAFQEYGYEEYTFICNGGACPECEGLSGKHFKVKDMQPGLNAPPMHPRCRCSTAAYMDREAFEKWLEALESGENVRWKDFESYQPSRMSAADDSTGSVIHWPGPGEKITEKAFKEIRNYANGKGIQIAGVKKSDLDIELIRDAIDRVSEVLDKYNIREKLKFPFTMDFSHSLRSVDFAESYPGTNHIIYFNKNAYRSLDALKREYGKLEEDGFFVKGTDYRAIPYHEMGHIIADIFNINSLELAKKITGLQDDQDVLENMVKELSEYSAKPGGDEIIAECYSAVLSGVDNEFALKFIRECDKIILEER